jgi:transposase
LPTWDTFRDTIRVGRRMPGLASAWVGVRAPATTPSRGGCRAKWGRPVALRPWRAWPIFPDCDREQELLLPPSLREWLPPGALGVVRDRGGRRARSRRVYASYREDGWGRAAHEPAMMVALLLYSYAVGERSSRAIERRCQEDIAFRVITADQAPDHATVARFRQSRGRAGRAIQRRACPVRRGRAGARGGARDRRHEGARQRLAAHHARLRADRQRDPGRGGGRRCGRGRSSVRRAATSCPRN